ncbi:hypothetical protein EYF80_061409 [Liparis tanakae]|uniref:Uncharacterized protein n=1 Tax=Liparis tanakae TaxID=230148 RepID=A0A4Z2EHZ6_9TELE|nr:hypothetical protein EYF80_061409 [Liparis tanakae]
MPVVTVGPAFSSQTPRKPPRQEDEDIFPSSVHGSPVIVWEDESIINNVALEESLGAPLIGVMAVNLTHFLLVFMPVGSFYDAIFMGSAAKAG